MTAVSVKPGDPMSGLVNETALGPATGSLVTAPARSPRTGTWPVAAVTLTLLGMVLLSLVADLTVLGGLRHHRDQRVKFDRLRADLANAVAPVGATNFDGRIYAPGTPIGELVIPKVGLRQVFSEGTSANVLIAGPGHRRDTVLPGQAGTSVLMARRSAFGGPFGSIARLHPGDEIQAVTGQGTQLYRVSAVRRQSQAEDLRVDASSNRLLLVTAGGAPLIPSNLIVVQADLVSSVRPTPQRVIGPAAIAQSEQVMASDQHAWVGLVFWLQGLLAAALGFVFARARWGGWQAWIVGAPVSALLVVQAANQAALLLPNLT